MKGRGLCVSCYCYLWKTKSLTAYGPPVKHPEPKTTLDWCVCEFYEPDHISWHNVEQCRVCGRPRREVWEQTTASRAKHPSNKGAQEQ